MGKIQKDEKYAKLIESNIQATLSVMYAYENARNILLQAGVDEEVAYYALTESRKSIDDIETNGANNICILAVKDSGLSLSLDDRAALHGEIKVMLEHVAEAGGYTNNTIDSIIEQIDDKLNDFQKDASADKGAQENVLDYEPLA